MDAVIENLNREDLLDILIRYGLYFAAVFQLICLLACIYLPNNTPSDVDEGTETDECGNNDQLSIGNMQKRITHHKTRKQEKKKRR